MTLRCEVCEKLIFLCKCEIGNGIELGYEIAQKHIKDYTDSLDIK